MPLSIEVTAIPGVGRRFTTPLPAPPRGVPDKASASVVKANGESFALGDTRDSAGEPAHIWSERIGKGDVITFTRGGATLSRTVRANDGATLSFAPDSEGGAQ